MESVYEIRIERIYTFFDADVGDHIQDPFLEAARHLMDFLSSRPLERKT